MATGQRTDKKEILPRNMVIGLLTMMDEVLSVKALQSKISTDPDETLSVLVHGENPIGDQSILGGIMVEESVLHLSGRELECDKKERHNG